MVRHIAVFRLRDDAPEGTLESLTSELSHLPGRIPEISTYRFGRDLGLREGNFDFGVVADFENTADFMTYANHPDHLAFIREHLTPVAAERVAIQFEF